MNVNLHRLQDFSSACVRFCDLASAEKCSCVPKLQQVAAVLAAKGRIAAATMPNKVANIDRTPNFLCSLQWRCPVNKFPPPFAGLGPPRNP